MFYFLVKPNFLSCRCCVVLHLYSKNSPGKSIRCIIVVTLVLLCYFIVNIFNHRPVLASKQFDLCLTSVSDSLRAVLPLATLLCCPLCQPTIRGGYEGSALLRVSSPRWILRLLRQPLMVKSELARSPMDPLQAGRQAHRLALVKKAPPLCSHRR